MGIEESKTNERKKKECIDGESKPGDIKEGFITIEYNRKQERMSTADLREKLKKVGKEDLKGRCRKVGIPEQNIEAAEAKEKATKTLLYLLIEHLLTEEEAANDPEAAALRADLVSKKVSELRKKMS